jgi:hypothetical protein
MEIFYFIGAIVLLAAIGYGLMRNIGRNKRVDPITDAATREQYKHPERYQHTQKAFEEAAKRVDEETKS